MRNTLAARGLTSEIADERLTRMYRQRWIVIGANVFALVVALIAPRAAVGLYLITTIMVLVFPLLRLVGHRRPGFA